LHVAARESCFSSPGCKRDRSVLAQPWSAWLGRAFGRVVQADQQPRWDPLSFFKSIKILCESAAPGEAVTSGVDREPGRGFIAPTDLAIGPH
jgi:hypothetical protein